MTSAPKTFPYFPSLPLELRLRIFAFAINSQSRTIDLWSDHNLQKVNDVTFYAQRYYCLLTPLLPHPLLHVTHESRTEALRHLSLEFKTTVPLKGADDNHGLGQAKWYVNWSTDVFAPRGYWNLVSFLDFIRKAWQRLKVLAIDVEGSFWKDNVLEALQDGLTVFEGLEEVILYDSSPNPFWRTGEYLKEFREGWDGERRNLNFVEGQGSEKVKEVEGLVRRYFKRFAGHVDVGDEAEESKIDLLASFSSTADTVVAEADEDNKGWQFGDGDDREVQIDPNFKAPMIRIMELVVSPVG